MAAVKRTKIRTKPSLYTEALATEILARLSGSEDVEPQSLRSICAAALMPDESTVRFWVKEDREGFAARYAEARDYAIDHMAQDIIRIADDSHLDVVGTNPDTGKPIVDGEAIARSRLRVDTRKWFVAKLAPKKYGDRLQVDADVTMHLEELDDAALNARLIKALGSLPKDLIEALLKG